VRARFERLRRDGVAAERQLRLALAAPGGDLLVARLDGDPRFSTAARACASALLVATLPQRQRRQRAQRADLERALAVDAHQAQRFVELATRLVSAPSPTQPMPMLPCAIASLRRSPPARYASSDRWSKRSAPTSSSCMPSDDPQRIQARALRPGASQRARFGERLFGDHARFAGPALERDRHRQQALPEQPQLASPARLAASTARLARRLPSPRGRRSAAPRRCSARRVRAAPVVVLRLGDLGHGVDVGALAGPVALHLERRSRTSSRRQRSKRVAGPASCR
jgi:hypothetical protein